jgi:hypothetical protein
VLAALSDRRRIGLIGTAAGGTLDDVRAPGEQALDLIEVLGDRLMRQERLAELVVGACAQVEEAAQEWSRSIGLRREPRADRVRHVESSTRTPSRNRSIHRRRSGSRRPRASFAVVDDGTASSYVMVGVHPFV